VRELGESGVRGLEIEQAQLGGGIGIHVLIGLTSDDGTCNVHGSVTWRET
jgi:hypothetical protein